MSDFLPITPMIFGLALFVAPACDHDTSETTCPAATAPTTTTDASRKVVESFADAVWTRMDPDAIPQFVAADMVNHAAIPEAQGAAGMQSIVRKLLIAFPDLQMNVTSIAADGDLVIVRLVFSGTHTGPLAFAKMPLDATNKPVSVDQVHTFRVADGRIVESWMVMDRLEFMTQLGMGPGA